MPRRIILAVFITAASAFAGSAADLSHQTRLGAIFTEPAEVRAYAYRSEKRVAPVIPYNLLPVLPWERGGYNYGSPWSYYYPGPYYGGPYYYGERLFWDGWRLPYACELYGYCS
jgi:hypothetical protein